MHPQQANPPQDPGGDAATDTDTGEVTANRRLFERHPVDKPCCITELDEQGMPGRSWEGRLTDVSRGGIGLRSRRMVYHGRHIFVEIERPSGGKKLLFGVVRQSRYAVGEGYAIGVEFREAPKTSAIRNWLSIRGLKV